MADIKKKYVSLDKLTKYDGKIKDYIETKDTEVRSYAESLASNYDAAGSAATVQGELDKEIARAKAAEEANAAAAKQAQDEVDALELVVKNIQENAYDDTEIVNLISGLDTNKADKSQVAADIAAAVKVEEEARIAAVSGVQSAVDALSGTHATDKTALEASIALKADQTALDDVSAVANAAATAEALAAEVKRAGDEEARIEGLVTAEAARATALDERLVEVETFFKTAADETIDTALDTLVEIQKYLDGEGAVADQMLADIAANAKSIEDMDAAYKAADQTLQGNIDTLAGTVATKADASVVEALDGRVEDAEGAIEENADAISELQAKFGEGEGSVADMIADAVAAEKTEREAGDAAAEASAAAALAAANAAQAAAEAADAKAQTAQDEVNALELVVDTKAAASDVTTLQGKVSTLEGDMTQAKSDIDAVEALAAANQAAIAALQEASATHATKAELQAESERAVAKENALQSAIDAFVEVSEEEINALFVVTP